MHLNWGTFVVFSSRRATVKLLGHFRNLLDNWYNLFQFADVLTVIRDTNLKESVTEAELLQENLVTASTQIVRLYIPYKKTFTFLCSNLQGKRSDHELLHNYMLFTDERMSKIKIILLQNPSRVACLPPLSFLFLDVKACDSA